MPTITFMPSGRIVDVPSGTALIDACRQAGFSVSAPCGEKGLCGKCRVRVLGGVVPVDSRQRACLSERLLAAGWRASCVADDYGDLIVADPDGKGDEGVILTDFMGRGPRGGSGLWERDLALSAPSVDDPRDDETRLRDALAENCRIDAESLRLALPLLARLPALLRESDFRLRAIGAEDRLLALWNLDRAGPGASKLGLAVDVGTTTLAAALCDMDGGTTLSVVSAPNPQALRGDDVVSRIEYASRGRGELAEMRSLIVGAIRDLAAAAAAEAGVASRPLLAVVAANTAMNHLLLGVPPGALAQSPFIPAFRAPVMIPAGEIGWDDPEPPMLGVLPTVSSYVGGDIVAGLLAHDVHRLEGSTLFLDVGTNGEIALAVDGKISACATAAGPAFEGARIRQGMRAVAGAISRVTLSADGGLETTTVGGGRPALGVCGTGLLDAVAALLAAGVIDAGGRILSPDETRRRGRSASRGIVPLLHEGDDGPEVWLERPAGRGGLGVALTQRDVRELQLAKGAIAAGVRILLDMAGLEPAGLDRVLLAGGFGNYLEPASAFAIGLLPAGIPAERVRAVGNASLAGARLCLLSEDERAEALELSRRVSYVELSGRADFQEAFAQAMLFPD